MCLSMLPLPIMAQKEEKVDTTFNLHELVVTGTRTPKLLKDAPILTRLISSSDIGKADATNVQDLLQTEMPGVEFSYAMNQLKHLNMSGFKSIVLGGVATSIDAAVVGLSMSMDAAPWKEIWPIAVSIFVFTALSVLVGMLSGSFIGRKLGYSARIVGGLVLIGLGVNILL